MVAAEGALTTMEERGTAVGFSDTKEMEGVGPVGVGNREIEPLETLEPVAATETAAEEAAEAEEAEEALMMDVTVPAT
jgi:hypothetical protein